MDVVPEDLRLLWAVDVNIVISSNRMNANELLRKIQNTVGGKGGGSSKAANGRLSRTVTTDELITILKHD